MSEATIRMDLPAAWLGPSLLITNHEGECGHAQPLTGFYVRETRHLATLRLEIDGVAPWCASGRVPTPRSWPSSSSTPSSPASAAAAAGPLATR